MIFLLAYIEFRVCELLHIEAMIPVEMRKNNDINILRRITNLSQLFGNGHALRLPRSMMMILAGSLRVRHTGINQQQFIATLYKIRKHRILFFLIRSIWIEFNRRMVV